MSVPSHVSKSTLTEAVVRPLSLAPQSPLTRTDSQRVKSTKQPTKEQDREDNNAYQYRSGHW
eukprot:4828235-Amphidinium_carterae.1